MKTLTVLALLCLVLLAGCGGDGGSDGGAAGDTDVLVIYSPHSPAIRNEFARAFAEQYLADTGRKVDVRWPDAGGSSDLLRQVQDKYAAGILDVDVVFGGGAIHSQLAAYGLLEPYRLPDDLLAELPKTIAGEPLYDPEFRWYGAAVSSFGLIYNKKLVADRKLPEVRQWSDMARPEFFGLVGVVDASQSGSVRKAYEIILQAYGYEQGMRVLMLMGGNARNIGRGSSEIPKDCAQGFIALGACIDFTAARQLASPGGEQLGFILPENLTVTNTDPIGILRAAPHRDVAERFVRFVMSRPGQLLWSLRKGAEGGPRDETLARKCVIRSIYTERKADLAGDLTDPFTAPTNTFYDQQKEDTRINIFPAYLKAMMVTNKRLLTEAWEAVIAAGCPDDLVAELTEPLVSEDEMLRLAFEVWAPPTDPSLNDEQRQKETDRRNRLRSDTELGWSEGFRDLYKRVAEKARERKKD
ncbi:MAG: ABC transporter substrate-binding protein [Planctomycetes bacterium]|nr:ABC transporter substrate-binding protein [Planctomycetota bacterium]